MTAVLEGEVIQLPRSRERNAARIDNLPDLDSKVSALSALDAESQMRAVTALLSSSRTGLLAAIAAQNLPGIVAFKAKAAGVQEIAKQLQLSRELQDDATEFVRRAERGLGVAIREGQARGEIRSSGNQSANFSTVEKLPSPLDFAKNNELSGGRGRDGIYAMTDGVTDEQFDRAIAEARAEGNVSRANVARKARQLASPPAPRPEPAPPQPDPATYERAKPRGQMASSAEILRNVKGSLSGIALTCRYIDPDDIGGEDTAETIREIKRYLAEISKHLKGTGAQK